jgi:hypothetical protein
VAVAAYYSWDRLGRPLEPATPIREIVERLKVAFPRAKNLFGWYANEAHYTAVPAEDHTPFSQTGWPVPDPQWVVCATDVMHRPDLGVDCGKLFPYWLAEARAGRTPWVKYLIWQATLYDVRNGWRPQANRGHFDHVHISTRTDHINTHLGSWSLVPGGDDVSAADVIVGIHNAFQHAANRDDATGRQTADAFNKMVEAALAGRDAEERTRDAALLAAITALAGNGGPDAAPIVAAINSAAEASRTQVAALLAEVADLKAKLAAAAHAEADALDQ